VQRLEVRSPIHQQTAQASARRDIVSGSNEYSRVSLAQVGWKSDVSREEEVAFSSGATDIEAVTTGCCRIDDDTTEQYSTIVHARTNGKG
jgi:hypothetical protein